MLWASTGWNSARIPELTAAPCGVEPWVAVEDDGIDVWLMAGVLPEELAGDPRTLGVADKHPARVGRFGGAADHCGVERIHTPVHARDGGGRRRREHLEVDGRIVHGMQVDPPTRQGGPQEPECLLHRAGHATGNSGTAHPEELDAGAGRPTGPLRAGCRLVP